ncbi:hypothetical protein BGW36DRAFT_375948 [Talaromyces proteolyticus]|uniref:CR-type domain-containing protein n=1 Tax=Talaromyces proteolyticus TaxID=1131652 RepID=A0AAD4KXK5_9EURO|nr:uncharacterized protein BGW36DRAFT_375948 [Talaromyces proteolyticus]KAH8698361.1 hypothetical protein BGW36DRAFT_375948 [Talaromyces proteolyticus]
MSRYSRRDSGSSSSSSASSSKPVGNGRYKIADPDCEVCQGTGLALDYGICDDCMGTGNNIAYHELTCTVCNGSGKVVTGEDRCGCLN